MPICFLSFAAERLDTFGPRNIMYKLINGLSAPKSTEKKGVGLRKVTQAVFWSFFGVRKIKDLHSDAASLSPLQLIVSGLIGAAILVLSLVSLALYLAT